MDITTLAEIARKHFDGYLGHLSNAHTSRRLSLASGYDTIVFPTLMSTTRVDRFFVVELAGAANVYRGLKSTVVKRQVALESYFSQFVYGADAGDAAALRFSGSDSNLHGVCITSGEAAARAEARFPGIADILRGAGINRRDTSGEGPLLIFGEDADRITFEETLLFNEYRGVVRTRHILLALVVDARTDPSTFKSWLASKYFEGGPIRGVQATSAGRQQRILEGAQFASLYLRPGVREPTLGHFLNGHPEMLKSALGASRLLHERQFAWQPGTDSRGDASIQPDFMLGRPDGYFDICDLKLPLLGKKMTRGEAKRRRLVDPIYEGAAQLAHYRHYFEDHQNAAYSNEKYGVRVSDPRLILIVGNLENISTTEVDEALRSHDHHLVVMDYDTLVRLYVERE